MTSANKALWALVLVLLFCTSNISRGAFRSRVEGPRFSAESAAHYRYASMVAEREPIPSLDLRAQWPEGFRVFREASPAMEYLFGWTYRFLPWRKGDFATFVRFFSAFIFSVGIFPLIHLSWRLWQSREAAFFSGLVFALALPLVARSSGFEFIRENLSLPLILLHLDLAVESCSGNRAAALWSAVSLVAALASWHGTQFYLIPFLAFMLAREVLLDISPAERWTMRSTVAAIAISGAAIPFLRETRFLLSISASLAAAYLVLDFLMTALADFFDLKSSSGRMWMRLLAPGGRATVAVVVVAAVLVGGFATRAHFESYSHLFSLVLYKLRFLRKPDDPGMLPFDARAFWVGPFNSPDALHIFVFVLPMLLLLPGPISRLARRARFDDDFEARLSLFFLALSFVLFLLIQRLSPFFGIFAALVSGGTALEIEGRRGSRIAIEPTLYMSLFVAVVWIFQDFAWEGKYDFWRQVARRLRVPQREAFFVRPLARDVDGEIINWIRERTEKDAVILSLHYISPMILTYADRPTNLNDFFESPRLRKKAERLLVSLYSSEEELYRFAREQGSNYLLLSAAVGCDPTKDSPLYQAGFSNMPPGCAAYLLMFDPDRLRRFELVYENEYYRLFRVGIPSQPRSWPRSPLFYEKELLWQEGGDMQSFYSNVMRIYALYSRAKALVSRGDDAKGERELIEALRIFYFYPAWRELDALYSRRGRISERESAASFAYRMDPNRADVCLAFAESSIELGKMQQAKELLERCLSLPASASVSKRAEDLMESLKP